MNEQNKNKINRRGFLRYMGAGAALTIVGCAGDNSTTTEGKRTPNAGKGEMTCRVSPTTGDKVSILGYGAMRWPTKATSTGDSVIDQKAVNDLVKTAYEHGVNYYDTSPAYCKGESEKALGIALQQVPREKVYIATKLSNFAPSTWSREASMAMYRKSFVELQTDYIDYYLLHSIGGGGMDVVNKRYIDNGMLDFLLEERKAGRIRNLGFSFHGDIAVFDEMLARHDKYKWDFVQIQLNYVDWYHAGEINGDGVNAEYLYDELKKRNIPAIIMEPLLGGRLASLNDHAMGLLKSYRPEDSIASWAFRFAGTPDGVLTVLSGMTYKEHLVDNLRTYCPLDPLADEESALLKKVADIVFKLPTVPCTDCKYCMPCPYGIDIPMVFTHYNKCVNEGNMPLSSQDANYAEARKIFLVGYDRKVPKLRQANHCIGCGVCRPHCPQRIDIPKQMARIDAYVEQLKKETL